VGKMWNYVKPGGTCGNHWALDGKVSVRTTQ